MYVNYFNYQIWRYCNEFAEIRLYYSNHAIDIVFFQQINSVETDTDFSIGKQVVPPTPVFSL